MIEIPEQRLWLTKLRATQVFQLWHKRLTQTTARMSRRFGKFSSRMTHSTSADSKSVRVHRPERRWTPMEITRDPDARPDGTSKLGICGEHGGEPRA
jgi:hypothetical protein